jgi:hypothetical protein
MKENPVDSSRWIRVSIAIAVGLFNLCLVLSAIIVPQLSLLHVFQSLIYVAVLVLTRRNSPWGFGIGVIIPVAWNCLNLFVTHLFQKGAMQLWTIVRTGNVGQSETPLVTLACMAHFLLIIACIAGFLQLRPGMKQWGQFLVGGFLAMAYFALMIAVAAPR